MKKLLFLFAVLLTSVGAWAQKPQISPKPTADGKWAVGTKWYTIKRNNKNYVSLSNADSNGFLMLNGTEQHGLAGLWCVVGDDVNGYSFYNFKAGTSYVLGAYGREDNGRMRMYNHDVTSDGSNALTKTFAIATLTGQTGYAFIKNHGSANDWWNERNNYLAYWNNSSAYDTNCTGSQFTFTEVAEDDIITLMNGMLSEYKENAKAALDMVSLLGVEDAKNNIDAIELNINAFAAIDAEVNKVTQYVTFRNGDTDGNSVRYNAYLSACMPNSKGHGTKPYYWKDATWSLRYSGNASFYIYNINNNVYLGSPSSNGVLTVTPQSAYTFESVEGYKVKLKCANETLHLNNTNGNAKVSIGWYLSNHDNNDVASHWYIENNFASLLESYKQSVLSALNAWGELSGVFETELVNSAKTAINSIVTADDYTIFASIDAELESVKNNVAEKYLTFKNSDTKTSARTDAYLAANMSTSKGFGTKTFDYNAIWSVQSAGGTYFYLYNEWNDAYLQNPSSGSLVTNKTQATRYAFQLVSAETCKVGFIADNETLHLGNDCALMSYDISDPASQWYVTIYDYKADLSALVDEHESNHMEDPDLGKYPTEAYNALVDANQNAKTVVEVAAAIDAFKKSKNSPVFMITGVKDYVVGKSVFDDGVDAPGFKTTNAYDKTMWWALDLTTTEVSVSDKVDIYNVGTGEGFWGKPSIRITETNENDGQGIKDDGIFLFYIEGKSDPIHYQASNSTMVSFGDYGATTGSAQKFIYIGDTYELTQLTDQYLASGNEVMELYNKYTDTNQLKVATGVNNYHETSEGSFAAAKEQALGVLSTLGTEDEIASAKEALKNSLDINQPESGKFYRLRCSGDGMKYLQSTLDKSNANDIRLQVLSNEKSVKATFCFINDALLSYTEGLYINAYNFNEVATKSSVVFTKDANGHLGTYNIKVNGRWIYGDKNNGNKIDSGTGNYAGNDDGYRWWLESVTSLPFTFKADALGYATFHAPVAVKLPEGVTAYVAQIVGERTLQMRMFKSEGEEPVVVPANTPVMLYKENVSADTQISLDIVADPYSEEEVAEIGKKNSFVGTVAAENLDKTKNCYSLQKGTTGESAGMMGFFKKTSGTKAGFKAWIETDASNPARAFTIIFDGDDATGLKEALGLENENVEIYDLSGRRLDKSAKGVNVIGGKLVVK